MSEWVPRTEDEVGGINDLAEALQVMERMGVEIDDVADLSDALGCIRRQIRLTQGVDDNQLDSLDRVLQEAVLADRSNRQSLQELFLKAQSYVQSLPDHFRHDLQHVFPDVTRTLHDVTQQLRHSDCIIVVAGEKGSGKSSLVNLLVGCKILPTSMVHGTRTICELRHSDTKRFILHHWDEGREAEVRECCHDNEMDQFLEELTYHVTCLDQETEDNPYRMVEIYWPLPVLGEGVVIVDSPGIGESRKVSRQLENYISRAFGFIYVINISNAGGIHKDRLGQLLRQAVENSEQAFDPSTALFVCNWWDQVHPRDQEHVLHETLNRLARVWPGVRSQQIFPLSSTESLRAVERGTVEDRYRDLVQGICHVLPVTFNVKLSQHYSWLSSVLKRSLYCLKLFSSSVVRRAATTQAHYYDVRHQIEALKERAGNQIDVMRTGFRREVDNIIRKLTVYLKSDECLRALCTWTQDECPAADKDRGKVIKEAASRFRDKLATVLDDWERHNEVVAKVRTNILRAFQRDLDLFENQMVKIEGVLFAGIDHRIVTDLHNSLKRQMPVKNVWKKARKDKGGQDQGCFSLGSAITGAKSLDIKATPVKNVFKSGVTPQAMAQASSLFLLQFKDEEVAHITTKFFDKIGKRFDAATKLLQEFLRADRSLMEALEEEMVRDNARFSSTFPALISTGSKLAGQLDLFFADKLKIFDFHMDQLQYDPARRIGQGSFADVYRSTLKDGDTETTVALKIQRDPLTAKNISSVLLEDETLRTVRHENIIGYYGAAAQREGSEVRWVMVLELCKRTIKERFVADDANVPGRQEIVSLQMDAMREVAQFASQICSALCYLHERDIVHRDLKADNILLTEGEVVKIADLGLAKAVSDLVTTMVGTPVYMAPEILHDSVSYNTKVDVYSLAIILWEMWYGQDVADHISAYLIRSLRDSIQDGLRPALTLKNKPPDDWTQLMQAAWHKDPNHRPSSHSMLEFFQNFLREHTHL